MARARDLRHLRTSLVGVVLFGIVLLLPDLAPGVSGPTAVVEAYRGRIESIQRPAVDTDPDTPPVPIAKVRMLDGPQAGQIQDAYLSGPGGSQSVASYRPGEEVVVTITHSQDGTAPFVTVSDRWRLPWVQLLSLVFAAAVVIVGGWRGVRALVALGFTIAVVVKILLPLLVAGVSPVPLAVVAASGITIATILLTEGWKRSSLAAILGTTGALAITGLLAAAATAVMGFSYVAGDLAYLTTANGAGLDLRGVLLAAFILGAVGVLDDVTVTQAALVDELADKGGLRGSRLFASSMSIGRSHIAATVNTLFLAYLGAGLPLLVLLIVSAQPGALVFNDELITIEIVRALVGSLGIVAAVPLTTFIAGSLIDEPRSESGTAPIPPYRRAGTALAAGGVIAALLAITAALPLTSGPRPAVVPDVFDPGGLPSARPSEPPAVAGPSQSPAGEPALAAANEPVPVTVDGRSVGTVTVVRWTVSPPQPPNVDASISVFVRYDATEPFRLTSGRWELLLSDGTETPLVPTSLDGRLERTLIPGTALEATLEGRFPERAESPFIAYVDRETEALLFLVLIE